MDPPAARAFQNAFEGFSSWGIASEKVCEVCWSNVLQGVDAHIERHPAQNCAISRAPRLSEQPRDAPERARVLQADALCGSLAKGQATLSFSWPGGEQVAFPAARRDEMQVL